MALVPPDSIQSSGSSLCISWNGKTLDDSPKGQGLVVRLALVEDEKQYLSESAPRDLHLTLNCSLLDPITAKRMQSIPHWLNYYQTVTDPSILYLLQLLQTEMQTSQPMSQMVVSSIATVLTTYLLRHWQAER
jgi:hypothetical protein